MNVKDQKVFVKLGAVTALQKRYHRAQRAFDLASQNWHEARTKGDLSKLLAEKALAAAKARMEAFEEAIAVMELPIS